MTTPPEGPMEITVRYRCGAYVTPRVAGRTASSTMSAQAAAELLAYKLWGDSVAQLVRTVDISSGVWRIGPERSGR